VSKRLDTATRKTKKDRLGCQVRIRLMHLGATRKPPHRSSTVFILDSFCRWEGNWANAKAPSPQPPTFTANEAWMAETANRILLERLGAERRTDPLEAGSNLSSGSSIARAWPKARPKAQRRLINASSRVGGATYGNSLKRRRIDADDCVRVDPTHVLSWCTEKK